MKSLLIFGGGLVTAALSVFIIAQFVLLSGFKQLEQREAQEETERVQTLIDAELATLSASTRDWSAWHDTYKFIAGDNSGHVEEDIYHEMFENMELSAVAFLDPQGNLLYGRQYKEQSGELLPLSAAWQLTLNHNSWGLAEPDDHAEGAVVIDGQPTLLSARRIVDNELTPPMNGTLIFARAVDEDLLLRLGEIIGHPLSAEPATRSSGPGVSSLSTESPFALDIREDAIRGYLLIPDTDGHPQVVIQIQMQRSLFEKGESVTRWMLVLYIGVAAGLCLGLLVLLNKTVISRLSALRRGLVAAAAPDGPNRVPVLGNDEIGHVAVSVNEFIAAREASDAERAKAHAELSRVKQRLDGILASMHDLVFSADAQTHEMYYINNNAQEVLGYSSEAFAADPSLLERIVHPEDRDDVAEDRARLMKTGVGDCVYRIIRPDGEVRWVRSRTRLLHDESGAPRIDGSITDVTARRRAEDALRTSEAKWRSLVDHSLDIVTILDTTGSVVFVNAAVTPILGYTNQEYVGRSAFELVHPDDRARLLEQFTLIATNLGTVRQAEFRYRHADGKWLTIEAIGMMLPRIKGEPSLIITSSRDITQRREQEHQVRFQAQLLDSVGQAVVATTPDGAIEYLNRAAEELYGWPAAEALGKHVSEVTGAEMTDEVAGEVTRQLDAGRAWSGELVVRRRDGTEFPVLVTNSPAYDEGGELSAIIGVAMDITERRQAEEALRRSEERWRAMVQNASDIIAVLKPDTEFEYVSPSSKRITGRGPEELIGVKAACNVAEEDRPRFIAAVEAAAAGAGTQQVDFRVRRTDGRWCSFEAVSGLIETDDGARVVLNVRDVTERREAEATINHLAYHDSLTGLPNRLFFQNRFAEALAQASREQTEICILSIDLDRFKIVNDSLGHSTGDELLKAAARRLRHVVREGDTLARLGGDEFIILARGDGAACSMLAERIVRAFRRPFDANGTICYTTASIGVSVYPHDGLDTETLTKNADAAMYAAKEAGRDTYRKFLPDMTSRGAERITLERDLRLAIKGDQMVVYYQPQVDILTGDVRGVEALARWNHPQRGMVSPAEFIPLAEETDLIVPLGEQVLRRACADAVLLESQGAEPMRLAVNVSYRQLQHAGFVDTVRGICDETGYSASRLQLEITETAALKDIQLTNQVSSELAAMGVTLSIDDFGAGNTSLRYLSMGTVHELKIDRGFIRDLQSNAVNAAIATSVIALGQQLHLNVIAEGVEQQEQLDFLRAHGCNEFQGFLHSRPMPLAELLEFLRRPAYSR